MRKLMIVLAMSLGSQAIAQEVKTQSIKDLVKGYEMVDFVVTGKDTIAVVSKVNIPKILGLKEPEYIDRDQGDVFTQYSYGRLKIRYIELKDGRFGSDVSNF